MKVGVFLFPESRFPELDGKVIKETVQEAIVAEQLGAEAVFLAEHHFDSNCAYVDPPVFASHLAGVTSRIKIGFAVLQTSLYHPLRLAEQISLLDQLSDGRMIVGLGRGSAFNMHEYIGFEVDPESAQERFEEIESILLNCWNTPVTGTVSHKGKYWNIEIPMLRPRTFTQPHPPLLRSVSSDASLIGQAKVGRPVIIGANSPARAVEMIALYRSAMLEAGFSKDATDLAVQQSWVARHVIIAPTAEEVAIGEGYYAEMQTYRSNQSEKVSQRVAKEKATTTPRYAAGTPDQLVPEFQLLKGTGIGGVIVRFRSGPMPTEYSVRGMKLFMNEVMPALN